MLTQGWRKAWLLCSLDGQAGGSWCHPFAGWKRPRFPGSESAQDHGPQHTLWMWSGYRCLASGEQVVKTRLVPDRAGSVLLQGMYSAALWGCRGSAGEGGARRVPSAGRSCPWPARFRGPCGVGVGGSLRKADLPPNLIHPMLYHRITWLRAAMPRWTQKPSTQRNENLICFPT